MFQALDRFKLETETGFTSIQLLNDKFGFFNPHLLLQSESHNYGFTNAFKSTYDDKVQFLKLATKIDRFKRLVRCSKTTFDRNATAFEILQWLAKSHLLIDSTLYSCTCLKLYFTFGVDHLRAVRGVSQSSK